MSSLIIRCLRFLVPLVILSLRVCLGFGRSHAEMNILPKKRWHVRTRENIARVRRDEAQAAEEEKERERKAKLAEKEARTEVLRARARLLYSSGELKKEEVKEEDDSTDIQSESSHKHVNFFEDLEAGIVSSTAVNKEHEEEKKQEKEKYEKQIGYLTYLGQDTVEATGNISWYNKQPERVEPGECSAEERGLKHKVLSDPLSKFRKFCTTSFHRKASNQKSATTEMKSSVKDKKTIEPENKTKKRERSPSYSSESSEGSTRSHKKKRKHKHKKSKKRKKSDQQKHSSHKKSCYKRDVSESDMSESDSESNKESDEDKRKRLESLRAERLRREKEEKKKAEKLLAKINGVEYIDDEKPPPKPPMKQRYNSQFNPYIAKQNYEDQRYRFEN